MGHRGGTAVGLDEPLRRLAEMLLPLEQQPQLQPGGGTAVRSLAEVFLGQVVEPLANGVQTLLETPLRCRTEDR